MVSRRTVGSGVVGAAAGVLIGSTMTGTAVSAEMGTVAERESWHAGRDYTLIRGARVVTQDARLGTLPRGDILIYKSKIEKIAERISAPGARIIDATNMIALPGLIDNHRHLWTRLFAGISVDHLFGPYFQLISQRASQRLTPDHMRLSGYVGGLEAINSGVTTVLDWNHACYTRTHAYEAVTGLYNSGVRGVFGYAAPSIMYGPDVPPTEDDILAVNRLIRRLDRMELAIPPRSPRQVTTIPGGLDRIRTDIERARALGVPVTMHTGLDTDADFQWLLDNDLVGPDSTYIHANMLSRATFTEIAQRGGHISASPEVEMQMFGLAMPLEDMRAAGVSITLSSDLPASQRSDLLTQAKIGLQTQRMFDVQAGDTSLASTASVLPYVTMNAARSLLQADEIGSLTPGKQADVVLVRGDSPSTLGIADLVTAVLAYATLADIDTVIVAGKIRKRHGRLLDVALGELHSRVLNAQRELLAGL